MKEKNSDIIVVAREGYQALLNVGQNVLEINCYKAINLSKMFSEDILKNVEDFCVKLRPIADVCYLEHRFNDQIIPLAKEFDILGLPVPKEFGGREADIFTYIKSFERIGVEGN